MGRMKSMVIATTRINRRYASFLTTAFALVSSVFGNMMKDSRIQATDMKAATKKKPNTGIKYLKLLIEQNKVQIYDRVLTDQEQSTMDRAFLEVACMTQ